MKFHGGQKVLLIVTSFLLALSVSVGCSSSKSDGDNQGSGTSGNQENPEFLNVGTAGTGGAYYPIGIAISKVLNDKLGINTTAQVTGGAPENVKLTQSGEVDLSITQSPMAVAGYNGADPYKAKQDNIATLFNGLSKGAFQLVVMKSSGIKSISDLKGKKVVMGPAGGGAINVVKDILSVYDMQVSDFKPSYISYDDGISQLSDNNVDAVIVQSAAPAPAIKQLAAKKNDFTLISIEKGMMDKLLSKYKYLNQMELPADMYGTSADVSTVYTTNMVIVSKDLSEDFVYKMTKAIFDNIDAIKESHPSVKEFSLEEAAKNPPIPLHPGAKKYFEEKGVLGDGN